MSRARFNCAGSDVYVFDNTDGQIECCSCYLDGRPRNFTSTTRSGMIAHLEAHRAIGQCVPDYVTDHLREEIVVVGDDAATDRWAAEETDP